MNNVLVPVGLLINGTSIARMITNRVTYFHVELPRHEIIVAEGLPVESYLDVGDRSNFDRNGAAIRLFPNFASGLAPATALIWEAHGAAPLVMAGEALAAARQEVMKHKGASFRRGDADRAGPALSRIGTAR